MDEALNELNGKIEKLMPNDTEIGICINKDAKGNIVTHYYMQPQMLGAQKTDSLFWALKEMLMRLEGGKNEG